MVPKVILLMPFIALAALCTSAEDIASNGVNVTPSTEDYIVNFLIPLFHPINLFDGPATISQLRTKPTTNRKPTLEQMIYYNYYAASLYCQYQLIDLSCDFCMNFKDHVDSHKVFMNNVTDTTALVTISHNRKEIVVTYRGAWNIMNVILWGLSSNVSPQSNIKVHNGIYIAAMSVYDAVVAHVGYLLALNPKYRIVFVGHSLGGAMARLTLFFWLFLNQFPGTKYELYTYGETRVGNLDFADYFNKQHITTARVVHRGDIVPHLVPTSILGTTLLYDYYVHAQTEFWTYGKTGKFCNQSIYEDPECSNSLGPLYSALDNFNYFDLNYLICVAQQPISAVPLPFNLYQPLARLPPLPKPISNFLGNVTRLAGNALFPMFGR